MFIQEAKQVAFNFRLQQMCNYKKQKFTHDQKMTSYYIVSLQLHGQFETAWNNSIISEKHWGKETLVKMSLKPRTTRKALNCSWLRKWTILTSIITRVFWLDISEAIIKLPLGRDDNHWYQFPANPEKKCTCVRLSLARPSSTLLLVTARSLLTEALFVLHSSCPSQYLLSM